MKVNLSQYNNDWYDPGRGWLVRALWYVVNVLFFINPLNPSSRLKVWLLQLFGARVGRGTRLKPRMNIKYPWNVEIGDYAWIGEKAWIDSLGKITIGSNVCISQGAYLCTGNHDWKDASFGLIVSPITMESGVWVGARAVVLPGVVLRDHSVITAGSVVTADTEAYAVYQGNPAIKIKARVMGEESR